VSARLIALFVIVALFSPIPLVSGTFSDDAVVLGQEDDSPDITRVYGVDYSESIYGDVSTSTYQNFVRNFTEIGIRHILTDVDAYSGNNMRARNYIVDCMENLTNGRVEVEIVDKHLNVVGRLPGYLPGDNPAFLIVGHYDSWFSSLAANEGGAGIGVILSLLEPLAKYEWPLDIYFAATNARYAQWGPFGSDEVAKYFANRGTDMLMVYTPEALLRLNVEAPQDEKLEMVYLDAGESNYHLGKYWAELAEAISKNVGQNLIKPVPHNNFTHWEYRYLEHTDFLERGFLATTVQIESGFVDDDYIRTPYDTWNNPSYSYYLGREIAGAIGGSIAHTMARAHNQLTTKNTYFELDIGRSKSFYIPISAPTTINLTSRWFGGTVSFSLEDPEGATLAYESFNRTSAWGATNVFAVSLTEKGLYRLRVANTGTSAVGLDMIYTYDSDVDGNGIMDSQDYWLDETLFQQDLDGDSISDAEEIILGTNENSADSDSDLLPDKYELDMGFDPTDPSDAGEDADGDTLTNLEEYNLGLNPLSIDSDQDLLPDNWELAYGLNPLLNDSAGDIDEDDRSNLQEYLDGTNPLVAETEVMTIPVVWILAPALVILSVAGYYGWSEYQERSWTEHAH
jgi:hypothetical protein